MRNGLLRRNATAELTANLWCLSAVINQQRFYRSFDPQQSILHQKEIENAELRGRLSEKGNVYYGPQQQTAAPNATTGVGGVAGPAATSSATTAASSSAAGNSGFGILATLIFFACMMDLIHQTAKSKQYQNEIANLNKAHAAQLKAATEKSAAEMAELTARVKALSDTKYVLEQELEHANGQFDGKMQQFIEEWRNMLTVCNKVENTHQEALDLIITLKDKTEDKQLLSQEVEKMRQHLDVIKTAKQGIEQKLNAISPTEGETKQQPKTYFGLFAPTQTQWMILGTCVAAGAAMLGPKFM